MDPAADTSWGLPDQHGVRARYGSTSRLTRMRRAMDVRRHVDTLLGEERALVIRLLGRGGTSVKAKTLFAEAGNARHVAIDAVELLLQHGWVELSEKRRGSQWELITLRWLDGEALRSALGLVTLAARSSWRQAALGQQPADERLHPLHASLALLGDKPLERRTSIVRELENWCRDQRTGTRVQFALFALGDTKAITSADWTWIERHVDPETLGISRHTPTLLLRGPIQLSGEAGTIDLRAVPDVIALSPATLAGVHTIVGVHDAWLLVENRTSFEDVARRLGNRYTVVWMPGYVPDWWLSAMRALASLLPARAYIAADPDPAGIEIALRASAPWASDWQPWAMDAKALQLAGEGRPLTEDDRSRLARLANSPLPLTLAMFVRTLQDAGKKAEQEALDLPALLPLPLEDPASTG
ncbi:hypothetical protein KPL74_19935 [Bacillus sp. NP157]|nr:hypothetical protein KPL74_19935 [Bacillus sp. NP157]